MAQTMYVTRPSKGTKGMSRMREVRERGPEPMTVAQLAELTGFSAQAISLKERGLQRTRPGDSLAIAEALGVERDELFEAVIVYRPNEKALRNVS